MYMTFLGRKGLTLTWTKGLGLIFNLKLWSFTCSVTLGSSFFLNTSNGTPSRCGSCPMMSTGFVPGSDTLICLEYDRVTLAILEIWSASFGIEVQTSLVYVFVQRFICYDFSLHCMCIDSQLRTYCVLLFSTVILHPYLYCYSTLDSQKSHV